MVLFLTEVLSQQFGELVEQGFQLFITHPTSHH